MNKQPSLLLPPPEGGAGSMMLDYSKAVARGLALLQI